MLRNVGVIALLAGMAGVVGCASSSQITTPGGVERQVAMPAGAAPCESAGIRLVSEGEMVLPRDSMPAFHTTSSLRTLSGVSIVYDVTPDGRPANLRYGGNPDDFHSDARRSLIRAMRDQVATFEYAWDEQPSHAVACRYTLDIDAS